jgi:hypothetical protein
MSLQQQFAATDIEWRHREYDDAVEFVADLGPEGRSSVDVVGDTIIAVAAGEQYEFDTDGETRAEMSNGVLTIEVDR